MDALIDSNIFVDHLRGKGEATEFLKWCIDKYGTVYYSVITRIELMAGMRKGEEEIIDRLLNVFEAVEVTGLIANAAGLYMNKYVKSHGINTPDAIIAASAQHKNACLYSLNLKHFPMKDIKAVKPY